MFGSTIEHVYLGRFMAGLTGGGVFVLVPLYVSEIAEDKYNILLKVCVVNQNFYLKAARNFGIIFHFFHELGNFDCIRAWILLIVCRGWRYYDDISHRIFSGIYEFTRNSTLFSSLR